MTEAEAKQRRRRGAALEDALLTAAWEELIAGGYSQFTIEGVAVRARTSTPVLYRRWPGRWQLALAAFRHYAYQNPVTVRDTGSLRGDLVAYLREASAKRAEMAVLFSLGMAAVFQESGTTLAELRAEFLAGRTAPAPQDEIYDRAVARGEIDPVVLTPRVRTLAFDLIRNELMMTLHPVPAKVIDEIVDEIVLPLLTRT